MFLECVRFFQDSTCYFEYDCNWECSKESSKKADVGQTEKYTVFYVIVIIHLPYDKITFNLQLM